MVDTPGTGSLGTLGLVNTRDSPGDPVLLTKTELELIEETETEVANHIGTVLLTVVRDVILSGKYSKSWYESSALPALSDVFQSDYAGNLERELRQLDCVQGFNFPIYGNLGDGLSLLSRVLVCCRDYPQLDALVRKANESIHAMGVEATYMSDQDYLRHLRNAVLHSRFKILEHADAPFESTFVFLDVRHDLKKVTAKIRLTNKQLMEIVKIVALDVFAVYLKQSGWRVR